MTEINEYPWCKHGINKTGHCADCKVASLITTIESLQAELKEESENRRECERASLMWKRHSEEQELLVIKRESVIESQKEKISDWEATCDGHSVQLDLAIKKIESQKEEIERWNSLRPEVQWFAEQMEISLRGNEYKGGWKDSHQSWLLGELHRNAGKLFDSRYNIRRAVNVANFAMMIADNTRNGGKPNETNLP